MTKDQTVELSVVIPVYNRERSVRATIDSVLACGVEAEIVVVDDGSTDGTVAAVRSYGARVKLLEQPNAGPAGARNNGFKNSTGSIVAFLDSDDLWLPGVVAECLGFLRTHPEIDVLASEALFGNATNGYQPVTHRLGFPALMTDPIAPGYYRMPRSPFVIAMMERMQVFLGAVMIRRSALPEVPFDPALFGGEDYELCLRLAATKAIAFYDKPLARYEKHEGGISNNSDRMAREFALAMRSMVRHPEMLSRHEWRFARRQYAQQAYWHAYRAYDKGDYREARRRFAAALAEGRFRMRAALFWLACCMPGPLLRSLRGLKHRVGGGP
ncbi:MAG TPA: glycosyltransferase [Urbifossiella sp.]|nr:glycosyltransferase [Urbifossiella sp.]